MAAPGRNRTSDPRIRSPPLCPLSYRRSRRKPIADARATLRGSCPPDEKNRRPRGGGLRSEVDQEASATRLGYGGGGGVSTMAPPGGGPDPFAPAFPSDARKTIRMMNLDEPDQPDQVPPS